MNDWYRLTFSADDISAAKHLEMEGHFEKFFLAAGSPEDATLYRGLESGRTIYYFSPGAARIAMKLTTHLSAVQCPAPPLSAVAFAAGRVCRQGGARRRCDRPEPGANTSFGSLPPRPISRPDRCLPSRA